MSKSKGEGQMEVKMKRTAAFLSAVVGVSAAANAQSTPSAGFFDWDTTSNPTTTNYTASPFLNNSNAASVGAVLAASQAAGKPLAVKIVEPLTSAASKAIFNTYKVDYVFCDFEAADSVGLTRAVADTVLSSTKSSGAFVGNFNFYPNSGTDSTRPGAVSAGAPSFQNRPYTGQFADSRGKNATKTGVLMSNEALYPGSPDYKTAGTSELTNTPNVRSALFTLPIIRLTGAETGLKSTDKHIPWVTRFNNYGNSALDNSNSGVSQYEYLQNAANPANGQLPSRGDFSAQILHYRLRGADSVNLFEASISSVVGYTRAQARADVSSGWGNDSTINNIFSRNKFALANLTTVIGDTGNNSGDTATKNVTQAGAIWSGVYDTSAVAQGTRRLAILISNLGTASKTIDLPNLIGGFHTYSGAVADDDYVVAAGTHRLLTFTLAKNSTTNNQLAWLLSSNSAVFTDNNRNGIGIPEPTTAGLFGLGALGLLARRRRQA